MLYDIILYYMRHYTLHNISIKLISYIIHYMLYDIILYYMRHYTLHNMSIKLISYIIHYMLYDIYIVLYETLYVT